MITFIVFTGYTVLVSGLLIFGNENAEINHQLVNEIMQITCL